MEYDDEKFEGDVNPAPMRSASAGRGIRTMVVALIFDLRMRTRSPECSDINNLTSSFAAVSSHVLETFNGS